VGDNYRGRGVHEAARIAALANGSEILASVATVGDGSGVRTSGARKEMLKGFSEPLEIVSVEWR
jgi:class 3 adenylate cyclase